MPRMPDDTAFGERPTPRPTRSISGYDASGLVRAAQFVGAGSENISRAILDAREQAERQSDADARLEVARARSAFLTSKIDADSAFDNDPDYQTWEDRYTERLTAAKTAAAEAIRDPRARELFELSVADDLKRGTIGIRNRAEARQTDIARAWVNETLASNRASYLSAQDNPTRQGIVEATQGILNSARDRGYITAQTADAAGRKWVVDAVEASVEILPPHRQVETLKNPEGALRFIPEDRRVAMLQRAENEVRRLGAQERAEIRTLARDHLASIQSTGQGMAGLSERAKRVLEPKDYEAFRRDEILAGEAFRFTDGARFATPQAMQQSLDRFKPAPGSEGFADRQRVHDHLSRTAAALLKARTDDPAGYGLQEPNVRQAWETAQKDPASIPVYAAKALALQSAMGIPERSRRVLPVGAASAIVTDLSAPEGAERAADTIQKLQENYGPYWPRVYAELVENRMPPRMAVLASLDTAADAAVRKDAAQFIKAGDKVLIAALNPTDKTEIDRTLPDASARWAKVELARGATERNVQSMRDFIRTLAYGYAGRGQSPSDAVKNATEAVLGRYEIMDSGRFALYAPKGRAAAVEDTGDRILRDLSPDDLPDPGGAAELTDVQRRTAYLESLRRTGRWVLNERGDGAFMVDAVGNPVMRSARNIEVKTPELKDAADLAVSRYPRIAAFDMVIQTGQGDGFAEFYPAEERDNPNPGRTTLQVRRTDLPKEQIASVIVGDALHQAPESVPEFGKLKKEFVASLKPSQINVLKSMHGGEGESRSFDDFVEVSGADAFIRDYFFQKMGAIPGGKPFVSGVGPVMGAFFPDQIKILERMEEIMKQPVRGRRLEFGFADASTDQRRQSDPDRPTGRIRPDVGFAPGDR